MNQRTYKPGDPHPTQPNYVFDSYRGPQSCAPRWRLRDGLTVEPRTVHPRYKVGDPHPTDKGRVFLQFNEKGNRSPQWCTPAQLAAKRAQKAAWQEANPEKARAHCVKYEEIHGITRTKKARAARKEEERNARNLALLMSITAPVPLSPEEARKRKNRQTEEAKQRRAKVDGLFALKLALRKAVHGAFYRTKTSKGEKTEAMLGCTFAEAARILESRFLPGMTWQNRKLWHIDHRIPVAAAKVETDLIRLNHINNLWPMWAGENLRKSHAIPANAEAFLLGLIEIP